MAAAGADNLPLLAGAIGAAGAVAGAAVAGFGSYLIARGQWRHERDSRVTDGQKQAYTSLVRAADQLQRHFRLVVMKPRTETLEVSRAFTIAHVDTMLWGTPAVRELADQLHERVRALLELQRDLGGNLTEKARQATLTAVRNSAESRAFDDALQSLIDQIRREMLVPGHSSRQTTPGT